MRFSTWLNINNNQVNIVSKSCSYTMSILITSNKHSLFKRYGTWMTTFSTNLYLLFSNIWSVILNSLPRNCFTIIKCYCFTSISKIVLTYITIAVANISNNIIKQYYGIIKNVQSSSYCQKEKRKRMNRKWIPFVIYWYIF